MRHFIEIVKEILVFAGALLLCLGIALAGIWLLTPEVHAAPILRLERTLLPETDSLYDLGTSSQAWRDIFTDRLCLTADTCRTSWPSGGTGSVGTSTVEGVTQVAIFSTNGATPALIGGDSRFTWSNGTWFANSTDSSENFLNGRYNGNTRIRYGYDSNKHGYLSLYNASDVETLILTANGASTIPYASSTALTATNLYATNFTLGSLSGLLKATAGVVSTATAGTDYATPAQIGAAYPFQGAGNSTSTLTQFNGGLTATNATTTNLFSGRLTSLTAAFGATASTTVSSAGALSTPTLTVGSLSGILKGTAGLVSTATAGSDYVNGSGVNGNCVSWGASNTLVDAGGSCTTGGGGGTVTSGLQGQATFYNANGTTVSGTSTLFIAQNRNVGVGSTSPSALLSIHAQNGDTNRNLFTIASSTGAATTTFVNVTNIGGIGFTAPNGVGIVGDLGQSSGSFVTLNTFVSVNTSGSGDIALTTLGTGNITFAGTKNLFTAGNVGIGTSTPGTKLGVNGDAVIAGAVTGRIFNATSTVNASTFPYASTTAITATTASTTNLVVSSVPASLLKTTSGGIVSAASAGTDYAAAGNYITALTGDVTATGPNSVAATLATVNANTGSFGGSTAIPVITANGKGLITALSTAAVVAPAGTLSGATLAAGVTASSLTSVGTLTSLTVSGQTNLGYASTTGISSGYASSTNLYGADLQTCNATTGKLTWANGRFACGTDFNTGSSFAYPFALTGNATSTLTQFNGGLTAYASSTIGNGTATGGLTVSGTATTTNLIVTSLTSGRVPIASTGGALIDDVGLTYSSGSPNTLVIGNVQSGSVRLDNGDTGTGITIVGPGTPGSATVTIPQTTGTVCLTTTSGCATYAYPFPSNATSTLITFNGNLRTGTIADTGGTSVIALNGTSISNTSTLGRYDFAGSTSGTARLSVGTLTGTRTYTAPDADGTLCLTTTCAGFSYPFPSNATTTLLAFNGGFTTTNSTSTNDFSGRMTALTAAFGATASTTISSTGALVTPSATIGSLSGVLIGTAGAVSAGVDGTNYTLLDAITCTNQVLTAFTAAGVGTCSSINNAFWSGTDLSVANGGTGLSTFGGSNHILYTTAADTLSSEAAFTYNATTDLLTTTYASSTSLTATAGAWLATAGGKVGIGTTSPLSKLSVQGIVADTNSIFSVSSSGGAPFFTVEPTGTTTIRGAVAATSTQYIYSTAAGKGGAVILEDVDGAGCTELSALNGVLAAKIVTCPTEI